MTRTRSVTGLYLAGVLVLLLGFGLPELAAELQVIQSDQSELQGIDPWRAIGLVSVDDPTLATRDSNDYLPFVTDRAELVEIVPQHWAPQHWVRQFD